MTSPLCSTSIDGMTCAHHTTMIHPEGLAGRVPRAVHWQIPQGPAPEEGWPVVILFHGLFLSSAQTWTVSRDAAYGIYHQALTIWGLLDSRFAVLAPEAQLQGTAPWDTNVPPWAQLWETSPDHEFMIAIFAEIEAGTFGKLDTRRLFAAGFSSGGYMTSRMALSFPGKFRALAVHSASYATCGGAFCSVPDLPGDHPPTLFLHGALDSIVPVETMAIYDEKLSDLGITTRTVIDPAVDHAWIGAAPHEVVAWFNAVR